MFYRNSPYFDSAPYREGIPAFRETVPQDLAALLKGMQGEFLLTYNDHPRTRELYKGVKFFEVVTRLNTDKLPTANRRPFRQLIIRTY